MLDEQATLPRVALAGYAPAGYAPAASHQPFATNGEFLHDCLAGLTNEVKTLPCKWLYDETGSKLFDQICAHPDYYPCRADESLIMEAAPTLASLLAPGTTLVELGSGASRKTRFLIEAVSAITAYVPVDISAAELGRASALMRRDYEGLDVRPLCMDFTARDSLTDLFRDGPVLAFFSGTTLGNFTPDEAVALLATLRGAIGADGRLLLGVDLIKDPALLLRAYDDRDGITAAFNLNILRRINRELGADIDVSGFFHLALWNEIRSCVEMHLVSRRDQSFRIGGMKISMKRGESIHTEDSFKFSASTLEAMFRAAGWQPERTWRASDPSFLLALLA